MDWIEELTKEIEHPRERRLRVPAIKERKAYEVNGRLFRTIRYAAKTTAWHFILAKYGDIQKVTRVRGMECDCFEEDATPYGDTYTPRFDASCCPLHERRTGYFKILHIRLTAYILKRWETK